MTTKLRTSGAPELAIEYVDRAELIPDLRNSRVHIQSQLVRLQASIAEFGFNAPVIIDESSHAIAGHARLIVAEKLGMASVPCVRIGHLTSAQKRALAIADNKIAELAEWDFDALRQEFASLCDLKFPVELTGFETAEIDYILDFSISGGETSTDPADEVPDVDPSTSAVTQPGDIWQLGKHRLACGNALERAWYEHLLGEDRASMVITDPPSNVPIDGHVSGLGKVRYREFAMASGEMSSAEFTEFLKCSMGHMVEFSTDGSLHFIFMDWRGIDKISAAGAAAYTKLKALCVWSKKSGGMGSLYRSQHELVFVFKNGRAAHQNNIQLGKFGGYRTNLWGYAGVNSFGPHRDEDIAAHPTVKPVAMIADAMRDCSKRGDVILDPFAGSGTILMAAERTGRQAAAIELDPYYVDTAVRRWQKQCGGSATLSGTTETFDDVAGARAVVAEPSAVQAPVGKVGHD